MQEVTFDIDKLKDLIVMKQHFQLQGILDSMRDYSSKGNPIIIERDYNNASADLIATLSTLDQVNAWIEKTFPGFSQTEEE